MDAGRIRKLLEKVKSGKMPVDAALDGLRALPYDDCGYAKLDLHRGIRTGFPEVVFCQGKTCEQSVEIVRRLAGHHAKVLATRVTPDVAERIAEAVAGCTYHGVARLLVVDRAGEKAKKAARRGKYVMVLCAGTADLPVAEEAAVTAESMGNRVERAYDVGVAGLHRLLDQKERIVAGERPDRRGRDGGRAAERRRRPGRQPGHRRADERRLRRELRRPRRAAGDAQLLRRGVTVVNIDNGFGAGYFAHLVNR